MIPAAFRGGAKGVFFVANDRFMSLCRLRTAGSCRPSLGECERIERGAGGIFKKDASSSDERQRRTTFDKARGRKRESCRRWSDKQTDFQ